MELAARFIVDLARGGSDGDDAPSDEEEDHGDARDAVEKAIIISAAVDSNTFAKEPTHSPTSNGITTFSPQ